MKRRLLLISCICLLLCACGRDGGEELRRQTGDAEKDHPYYYYMEEEITAFVQAHEEELRRQIENAQDNERIREFDGIERVEDRRDSKGVIYYEYTVSGLMTSSLQAGFYYSAEDTPSSYGGASWAGGRGWSEVPAQEENLWRYEEDEGDNFLITRKICDNFYYVVAGN